MSKLRIELSRSNGTWIRIPVREDLPSEDYAEKYAKALVPDSTVSYRIVNDEGSVLRSSPTPVHHQAEKVSEEESYRIRDSPAAWIESISIFARYAEREGSYLPVYAEHEELFVCVAPEKVNENDRKRLEELGWQPGRGSESFFIRFLGA